MTECFAISADLLAAIQSEARVSPDREICGLLFGSGDRITEASAAANVAADPAQAFEIDPQVLFSALRAGRAGGPTMIGCYHSHPSGDATPSARDTAAAEPGRLWLIVAGGRARLWHAQEDGFTELQLCIV